MHIITHACWDVPALSLLVINLAVLTLVIIWQIVNIIDRLRDTKEFDNLIVTSYLKDGFGYSRYVALILWQCLSRCTVLVLISRLIIISRTAICRPNRLILITYMIKIVCSY